MPRRSVQGSSPEITAAVARIARAGRRGSTTTPEALAQARRDLAAAKIAAYVEQTAASAPPLSPEQRDRLATLLRTAPGGGRDE